jgi:PleD family two-component response regulator
LADKPNHHTGNSVTIKVERKMRTATILIVDDQHQVLQMAELMLRAAGYEVYGARNATDPL